MRTSIAAAGSLALVAAVSCEAAQNERIVELAPGNVSLEWRIDGSAGAPSCERARARAVSLTVLDFEGRAYERARFACAASEATIDLPDGDYALRATLEDEAGAAVAGEVYVDRVHVAADENTEVDVDFRTDALTSGDE